MFIAPPLVTPMTMVIGWAGLAVLWLAAEWSLGRYTLRAQEREAVVSATATP
ncbi:hypothetical protein ACFQX6_60810 [Streptosporangium lutulentum]